MPRAPGCWFPRRANPRARARFKIRVGMSSGLECHSERARYASVRRREGERRREEILRVERQREYRISISHVSICLRSDYTDYFHRSFSLELYIGFDGNHEYLGKCFANKEVELVCFVYPLLRLHSVFRKKYSIKFISFSF